jgi:hypothetical protein
MNKKEVNIKEQNVSGAAGAYQSPKAFSKFKVGSPFNTPVERPKRPSHTKMFDFK